MSSFSDRPFHAGAHVGLRAFDVDSMGRLRSPQRDTVFRPGENVAECKRNVYDEFGRAVRAMTFGTAYPSHTITYGEGEPEAEVEHVVGGLKCQCGFYAYFDGKNDYAGPGRVTAIIEGYGTYTIGSRGFRSSKAKLVALVAAQDRPEQQPKIVGRAADRDERSKRLRRVQMWGFGISAAANIASATFNAIQESWWAFGATASLAVVMLGLSVRAFLSKPSLTTPSRYALTIAFDDGPKPKPVPWDLIRRNYPDVPVYDSLEQALAEHPLTTPEPLTPDDEAFWTAQVPR